MSEQDTGRRIIANLDGEVELAYRAACRRDGQAPPTSARDPRLELPAPVIRSISGAATLLRAFGREGDRLWTPALADAARLAEVPGLPRPVLESGPLEELSPVPATLAWMETPRVAALRDPTQRARSRRGDDPVASDGASTRLDEAVWQIPPPDPEAVTRVNERRFGLKTAQALGCALPGARLVHSLPELEDHLRQGGADAAVDGRWVVKAPFSAAARSRLLGRPSTLSEPGSRRRAERLFSDHGSLLFEPWMSRTADFGYSGLVQARDAVRLLGPHVLEVDSGGHFRGIALAASGDNRVELRHTELVLFAHVAWEVGKRLGAYGYRGPFGIDAWRYRGADGTEHFHPLGEINARMTFGLVARALVERLRSPLHIRAETPVRLRLARGEVPAAMQRALVVPLITSTAADSTSSWLEVPE